MAKKLFPNNPEKVKEMVYAKMDNIDSIDIPLKNKVFNGNRSCSPVEMRCVGASMVYSPVEGSISSGCLLNYFPIDSLNY